MQKMLKDIRKGDSIYLFYEKYGERFPFKTSHIEFETGKERVLDWILYNTKGDKQHFSFIDWSTKVEMAEGMRCPHCGEEMVK